MSQQCPRCNTSNSVSDTRNIVRKGTFVRKVDQARVARYLCRKCKKSFSDATSDVCFRQKKRHLNQGILFQLVSGVSQRRTAFGFHINRKTVARKFLFLAELSKFQLESANCKYPKATSVQFDDLEAFIHTKLKPVSVPVMVESRTRRILGFEVCEMPAKGKLAAISVKKYGKRKDHRKEARGKLFAKSKHLICDRAEIRSDQNPHYPADVKKHFPNCTHEIHKGRRGCVVGQGELKKIGFDPLFSLNHTCAMLRENITRLSRKTWCTSKKMDCLEKHIAIYALFHNEIWLKRKSSKVQILLPYQA